MLGWVKGMGIGLERRGVECGGCWGLSFLSNSAKEEDNYVVTQIEDGEWMNYTVSIPTDGDYTVYLVYQSKGNSLLSVASDSEVKTEPMQLPSSIQWTEREIGKLTLPAGACVLRLQIEQAGDKLEIQKIIVK